MKKRIGIWVLILCIMFPQVSVYAAEKEDAKGWNQYVNLLLSKTKENKDEDSLASLEDSLEDVIKNIRPQDAENILDFVGKKVEEGCWDSKEELEEAIKEAEQEFKVTLTKEQKEMIISVAEKVKNLGIDPNFLVDQAEKIYGKYSDKLEDEVGKVEEQVATQVQEKVKEEISRTLSDYVSDMITNVKSFFKGIFKR